MLLTLIRYDIIRTLRRGFSVVTPLLFFTMIICLFPFAIGDNARLIAPGIIWVAALLAVLLSIDTLFTKEWETGCLDHLLLSPYSLTQLVSIKLLSHWITYSLPLIIISPVLGLLLHLPPPVIKTLMITLLLGTPVLTLFGALGAALMIGIRENSVLLPILILPFYIPVLIFGTSAITTPGSLPLLGALLLFSIATLPFLITQALKIGVDT